MVYTSDIKIIAKRTLANLQAIEKLHLEGREVFETTQLINSMLGLLIFPQQEYVKTIPKISLKELESNGWPIPKIVGNYQQVSDLNKLVKKLRNSIAHFNVEFLDDGTNTLRVLKLWNINYKKNKDWEVILSFDELKRFTLKFIDLILKSQ